MNFKTFKLGCFALIILTLVGCTNNPISSNSSFNHKTIEQILAEVKKQEEVPTPNSSCLVDTIDGWIPTWCEEFNYEGLPDDKIWSYQVGANGWGNNEAQYYTNARKENAYVKDGHLTITAIKESYNGANYTSARLRTINKADFKYGRFDIKAKLPKTGGTWSAIWMMPTKSIYGDWPKSGEIDIMEQIGNRFNEFLGTLHMGAYYSALGNIKGSGYRNYSQYSDLNLYDNYHVYSLIWENEKITWLFDEIPYFSLTATSLYKSGTDPFMAWPFDQSFHFILNVAVGGTMGGNISPTFSEDAMEVDYIRVFNKDYVSNDVNNPSQVSNIKIIDIGQSEAYVRFNQSEDDRNVKRYHLVLNDRLVASTDNSAYKLTELSVNTNYTLYVVAEDYSGKLSIPAKANFKTKDYPNNEEVILAKDYYQTRNAKTQLQLADGIYHLAYLSANDTFKYRIKVLEAGVYKMVYEVAVNTNSEVELFDGNSKILDTTLLTSSGGYFTFKQIESSTFVINDGLQDFTIKLKQAGFNLRSIKLVRVKD